MATCFVIQPFDRGAFDKRYDDVFVPAITEAGLEAYRVDRDPSAVIPIEEIEQGIRRSDACLADISESNPNVWFEVGYAIAANKPLVMVCLHDPSRRFPFDIQHRAVITYLTESARDFEELQRKIVERLQAVMRKENELGKLAESTVVADLEGLSQIEMVALATIAANASDPDDGVPNWSIRQDMEKAGYTRVATTLGLRSLLSKQMATSERRRDERDDEYTAYQITPRGFDWLVKNQERFVLRRWGGKPTESPLTDDDVPF